MLPLLDNSYYTFFPRLLNLLDFYETPLTKRINLGLDGLERLKRIFLYGTFRIRSKSVKSVQSEANST